MTESTTAELESLARTCAKAYSDNSVTIHCLSQAIIPILRPHFERHERLREAAERCVREVKKEIYTPPGLGFAMLKVPPCIEALKAALHPNHQEPSDEPSK